LVLPGAAAGAAERGAAVREPVKYEVDDAVGDPAEWTKRFVGRFRLDGSIHHESEIIDHGSRDADPRDLPEEQWTEALQGRSDCIDFTEAAGLQCVLNVFWQQVWGKNLKIQMGGVPDLTPGMLLAGLLPSTAPGKIQILEVDTRGLAHPGAVELRGVTAITRLPCVNMPGTFDCEQKFTITAKPDSKLIFVVLTIRVHAVKAKLDRKIELGYVISTPDEHRLERSTELLEERLTISFTLRREPQAVDVPRVPAANPPVQGSR
jgi:hypothetical protein